MRGGHHACASSDQGSPTTSCGPPIYTASLGRGVVWLGSVTQSRHHEVVLSRSGHRNRVANLRWIVPADHHGGYGCCGWL
jgi:hypothetical protein